MGVIRDIGMGMEDRYGGRQGDRRGGVVLAGGEEFWDERRVMVGIVGNVRRVGWVYWLWNISRRVWEERGGYGLMLG